MNCKRHDEYAANSQFITHLVGRILRFVVMMTVVCCVRSGSLMSPLESESPPRYTTSSWALHLVLGRTSSWGGGCILSTMGPVVEDTPINTKGFDAVLGLIETTCSDSFELFYGPSSLPSSPPPPREC